MEFIIVLPIYLVFLGMAFCFGELSLHGVNLAASGDRTVAMAYGSADRAGFPSVNESVNSIAKAISPFSGLNDQAVSYHDHGSNEKVSRFNSNDKIGRVADTQIKGAWSWLVTATLRDDRALTPWTRGLALAWKGFSFNARMTLAEAKTTASNLFKVDSIGRVTMTSKDVVSGQTYAFYTLMRKPTGFEENSYRQWGVGWIVDGAYDSTSQREKWPTWKRWVEKEGFPTKVDGFDFAGTTGSNGRGVPSSGHSDQRPDYVRDSDFVTWSK